jgi:hypothetical protein
VAVGPGGSRDGSLLDLTDRDRPAGQKAKYNVDATRDAAIAPLPASDTPRADAKQLSDAVLREAECAKRLVEFSRGVACFRVNGP